MTRLEYLNGALERAISFVRFAETKNATLFAAGMAIILAVAQNFSLSSDVNTEKILLFCGMCCVFLGLMNSLVSFFPRKKLVLSNRSFHKNLDLNVAYFGDLEKLNSNKLIEVLEDCFENSPPPTKLEFDLADQIIQNSIICEQKLSHFSRSMFLLVCGSASLLASISIKIYNI